MDSRNGTRIFMLAILGFTICLTNKIAQLGSLALKLVEPHVQHVTHAHHANEAIVIVHWQVANIS